MPEVNGIQATLALRAIEQLSGRHRPVVAMTALVMQGDRERCLVAEMDGYLSKLIQRHELDELLERYVMQSELKTSPPLVATSVSRDAIDGAELLGHTGADCSFLSELTELFREDYPIQLKAAHHAIAQRDAAACGRVSHTLRDTLANLAANEGASIASELKLPGNNANFVHANNLTDHVELELARVVAGFEALRVELPQ